MQITPSNKILIVLTIITVIFSSGHAFQTIFPILSNLIYPTTLTALFFVLTKKRTAKVDKTGLAVLLFMVMIGCTIIVNLGSGMYAYIQIIFQILLAYCITQLYSFKHLVRCHIFIMTWITLIAIVCYALLNTTSLMDTLPLMTNYNGMEFRGIGIYNYNTYIPMRNCGMFWEPGLFATHLTISMVFELLYQRKTNIWRILLFSVGIFTANSSAGFVLWFLCMMLWLVRKRKKSESLFKEIVIFIGVLTGILLVLNFDAFLTMTGLVENEYLLKLSSDTLHESTRVKALQHNIDSFLSAPIFGVGLTTSLRNIRYVADTSTSTYLLSVFGVMGGLYTFYWIYGIVKNVHVNLLSKIILLVIVVAIINKEPHYQILLTWCILFYLIQGKLRNVRE